MNRVSGIGRAGVAGRAAAKPGVGGGFSVGGDQAVSPAEVAESPVVRGVALSGILALQEQETDTAHNRAARRHGGAMLDALERLQTALLGFAGAGDADIASLARLAAHEPGVVDPGLADVLAAIRLRAKIELLRRGVEIS